MSSRIHFQEEGIPHSEVSVLLFRYKFFSRIFCCVGLVCLFTALLSPFWLTIIQPDFPINVGLWNICKNHTCRKLAGNTKILLLTRSVMSLSTISGLIAVACVLFTKSSLKHSKWPLITNLFTANLNGAKTLLIMALFSGFVGASFMSITYRYSTSSATYQYLVPAVGSFIAAAFVFLGLSVYTIRISTHGASRTSATSYQWPFYLAWITCPFFILSGFLGLVAHQHMLMHGAVLSDRDSGESVTSSIWSSASSSSQFWDEEEKDSKLQIARA